MALDKDEIASSPVENTSEKARERDVSHEGILAKINRIIRSVRFALPVLAILGFGKGCAHQKIARHSPEQAQRNVCIVGTTMNDTKTSDTWGGGTAHIKGKDLYHYIVNYLKDLISDRYTDIQINDRGLLKTANSTSNYAAAPDVHQAIQENLSMLGVMYKCDDVIGLETVEVTHYGLEADRRSQYYKVRASVRIKIFNMETGLIVFNHSARIDDESSFSSWSSKELSDDLGDIIKRDLFGESGESSQAYRPEKLIPLTPKTALAIQEKPLREKIHDLFSKFEKTENPLPRADAEQIIELATQYLETFYDDPNSSSVKNIIQNISRRIEKQKEWERQRNELAHNFRNNPEVRELVSLIAQAQAAGQAGDRGRSENFFRRAENAAGRVALLFREAKVEIPYELNRLEPIIQLRVIGNEGAGITLGDAWGLVLEGAEKLRDAVEKQGLTAHLTLRIERSEFLINKPIENVEITVRQTTSPYSVQTWKTSKEGIISSGGDVSFSLQPGRYQISSPVFKDTYEIEVKEGSNDLRIEVQ